MKTGSLISLKLFYNYKLLRSQCQEPTRKVQSTKKTTSVQSLAEEKQIRAYDCKLSQLYICQISWRHLDDSLAEDISTGLENKT